MSKEAIDQSIEHWERMIRFAKTQPLKEEPKEYLIYKALQEDWHDDDCALCRENEDCSTCPLPLLNECCDDEGSTWDKVDHSKTWEEWLNWAYIMLDNLEKCKDVIVPSQTVDDVHRD
jgi:hypothetical protein